MTGSGFTPPFASPAHVGEMLTQQGHAVLSPQGVCELAACTEQELQLLVPSWNDLPPDQYLKDLHGGMQRWFEPVQPAVLALPQWNALLRWTGAVASSLRGAQPWYAEAHQFRIDTTDGIGRPTPEGAHRDGVDLVAVFLVARNDVKGGETRVFEADGPNGRRFTLTQPWSVLLLDDARVIHESTPIQPDGENPYRDTLVLTLRANGFQGDNGLT